METSYCIENALPRYTFSRKLPRRCAAISTTMNKKRIRGGMRMDIGIRLKYLATIANPANIDRSLCKNEYFSEFIDVDTAQPLYPGISKLAKVRDGERMYFFDASKLPTKFVPDEVSISNTPNINLSPTNTSSSSSKS